MIIIITSSFQRTSQSSIEVEHRSADVAQLLLTSRIVIKLTARQALASASTQTQINRAGIHRLWNKTIREW